MFNYNVFLDKRMKTILLFVIIILSNYYAYTQVVMSGEVIDKKTHEPLPYVNIGIEGKNVGTVSNVNGKFTISLRSTYDYDTLKFSIVGYESKAFIISELKKEFIEDGKLVVSLKQNTTTLREVVINEKRRIRTKTLGNVNKGDNITAGFYSKNLGAEVGTIIKIKKSPTYIESFSFHIAQNTFDSLFFRLNIYNLKDGIPNENILKKSIYINTDIEKGSVTIDLEQYNIIVEEDFFISLEYIEPLSNEEGNILTFSSGIFNNTSFERFTSQGEWKKVDLVGLGFNVRVTY